MISNNKMVSYLDRVIELRDQFARKGKTKWRIWSSYQVPLMGFFHLGKILFNLVVVVAVSIFLALKSLRITLCMKRLAWSHVQRKNEVENPMIFGKIRKGNKK